MISCCRKEHTNYESEKIQSNLKPMPIGNLVSNATNFQLYHNFTNCNSQVSIAPSISTMLTYRLCALVAFKGITVSFPFKSQHPSWPLPHSHYQSFNQLMQCIYPMTKLTVLTFLPHCHLWQGHQEVPVGYSTSYQSFQVCCYCLLSEWTPWSLQLMYQEVCIHSMIQNICWHY